MLSVLAASSLLAGAAGVEADTPNENAGLSSVFFPSSDDFGGTSAVLVVRLNALGAGTLVSFFCSPLSYEINDKKEINNSVWSNLKCVNCKGRPILALFSPPGKD